jgi:DNA polymerase V
MYGIVDCDNFYASCERVFRPDLEGKPVVVLSNGDGCVVARSNEAKALGIKEGTPYFQMQQQFKDQEIAVFSSNYELYGDLSSRVVMIISQEAPAYFRYSIDECFVYLDGMERINLQQWGERLHQRIRRSVGLPVSIGLAPNKTLAKIASKLAKKFEVYRHCCIIDNDDNRIAALKWLPVEDVWGIGRRYAAKLQALGCKTAYDFAQHHRDWVRLTFNNINIVRTWQELNGEDVVPNEELTKKKSICTSRSFSGMIADKDQLRTHISNYASRCAEKLRRQGTVASVVGIFVSTNPFREDLLQYWKYQELRLITPTNSTIPIVQAATELLDRLFIQGLQYKRAGVIVNGISPSSPLQQDLFDVDAGQIRKLKKLDAAVDLLNKRYGSETVVIGAQQYTKPHGEGKADVFADAIKHDHKSKNPTTRWSDIIELK